MLVDIELSQGADIDPEFLLLRKGIGQPVVQAVDSLNHENILRSQLQEISPIFSLPTDKIVAGQFYHLAGEKGSHILVKLSDIQTFQSLIVVVPVFIPRAVYAVDKVIIHRDRVRSEPQRLKLDGKPAGKGSLS